MPTDHTKDPQLPTSEKPKKKGRRVPERKVARACIHCKAAHITCDEGRPCKNCIRKGLQDSCVDAPRKKKKYLLGTEDETTTTIIPPTSKSHNVHPQIPSITSLPGIPASLKHPLNQKMSQSASLPVSLSTDLSTPMATSTTTAFTMNPPSYIPFHHKTNLHSHSLMPVQVPDYMNNNLNLDDKTSNSTANTTSSPSRRVDFTTMANGFVKRSSSSNALHTPIYNSIDSTIHNNHTNNNNTATTSTDQADINFLSSAADSEYAILGNIIDQTMFSNNDTNNYTTSNTSKYVSPALSTTSDDFEYLNYQPLMFQNTYSNHSNDSPTDNHTPGSTSGRNASSPFVKPLQPIEMRFKSKSEERIKAEREKIKFRRRSNDETEINNDNDSDEQYIYEDNKDDNEGSQKKKRKLQYSDLYPNEPQCDASTNQYFIGTMSTIDGIKTHTFPEVVKQISKFKKEHPKKFKERNRRSAISFSIGILDDVTVPEIEGNDVSAAAAVANTNSSISEDSKKGNDETTQGDSETVKTPDSGNSNNAKCGLLYHEPSEIYEKVKQAFTYVKPYHDLNLYLKSRFPKEDLVQMSKSIAEYRPSFIAGMIKLKEDDLIFAEQCFQRTLLEYDGYIGISGTPTLVWRRSSQIAYVGDEFCILTGWSKDDLLGKSTFAVEIMDDKSCVEYFKIFSKIAFGDMSGDTITECTLLTPKGESIRTNSTWTLKRDVFGIPMMIIATFLPILT